MNAPATEPFAVEPEEWERFPGLTFDYMVNGVDASHVDGPSYTVFSEGERHERKTYMKRLYDLQFIYPEPRPPGDPHGTCAHAWFADRGQWLYALESTQRNAFVPHSMPEWLRMLSHRLYTANKRTRQTDDFWNCCLISYGTSSSWTFGEDPWHNAHNYVTEFFVADSDDLAVTVTRDEDGASFTFRPVKGSICVWRGLGYTMSARATVPFFRLSFRIIHPLFEHAQMDKKYPHRLAEALAAERRLVPNHMTLAHREAMIHDAQVTHAMTSAQPPPPPSSQPKKVSQPAKVLISSKAAAAPVKKKTAPSPAVVQVKREKPACIVVEEEVEAVLAAKKKKLKKAPPFK
jgi:hypothetical protein